MSGNDFFGTWSVIESAVLQVVELRNSVAHPRGLQYMSTRAVDERILWVLDLAVRLEDLSVIKKLQKLRLRLRVEARK